jgi:predicted nucleic acid-binding Zn ribbon protein
MGMPRRQDMVGTQRSVKGPELVSEVLARLFTARGWGRRQDRLRLEQAWAEAIGPGREAQTRVAGLRRGVLEIEVGNAVLLQEMTHFLKRKLLEQVRKRLPDVTVTDLRFRAGVVARDEEKGTRKNHD